MGIVQDCTKIMKKVLTKLQLNVCVKNHRFMAKPKLLISIH